MGDRSQLRPGIRAPLAGADKTGGKKKESIPQSDGMLSCISVVRSWFIVPFRCFPQSAGAESRALPQTLYRFCAA